MRVLLKFIILFAISFQFSSVCSLRAEWSDASGISIGSPEIAPRQPLITSDGSGGIYIVWRDLIDGKLLLFTQRLNTSGTLGWQPLGVLVSERSSDKYDHKIISAGFGGAIIAWRDRVSEYSDDDVLLQKIDSNGTRQFSSHGVSAYTGGTYRDAEQRNPAIVSDSAGGVIVVWDDDRAGSSNYDLYAQRFNHIGQDQWAQHGAPVCYEQGNQKYPQIAASIFGGFIIAWIDERPDSSGIYAQKIDEYGNIQWITTGVPICRVDAYLSNHQVIADGAGGAIITWQDSRNGDYDIYAQKMDASGNVQWTVDGINICNAEDRQELPKIISDDSGGAYIAWDDERSGSERIYMQRIDASGNVQWAADGISISDSPALQRSPQLASDGAGGVIITWTDGSAGNSHIYAQKINLLGDMQWSAGGIAVCNFKNEFIPRIAAIAGGGAIIAWTDFRNGRFQCFSQKVDTDGMLQWKFNSVPVSTGPGTRSNPSIASNGNGGMYVAWEWEMNNTFGCSTREINMLGESVWGTGVSDLTYPEEHNPKIITGDDDALIICWEDNRYGDMDIYCQKLSSGSRLWAADGAPVCTTPHNQYSPQLASNLMGGSVIVWTDNRSGYYNIYAQKMLSNGNAQWTIDGLPVCFKAAEQHNPKIVTIPSGDAVITWEEQRADSTDIYAQKLDNAGSVLWAADGVLICSVFNYQGNHQMISDDLGASIIVWQANGTGDTDIYVQKIDTYGSLQWNSGGIPVCAAADDQINPRIILNNYGGAIITWQDYRSGNPKIYTQRINNDGNDLWLTDGIEVCSVASMQQNPQITIGNTGGAIITWQDDRAGNADIYVQKIDVSGYLLWDPEGVGVGITDDDQLNPQIASDGAQGAIIVWEDKKYGGSALRANGVNYDGIPKVPAFLVNHSVSSTNFGVKVQWELSEETDETSIFIFRAESPDNNYREIHFPIIVKDGRTYTFSDRNCISGHAYSYRVGVSDELGRRILFESEEIVVPVRDLILHQNYPNPFNPSTTISFILPSRMRVIVSIYNSQGKLVKILADEVLDEGLREYLWDGKDAKMNAASSGIYFCRLVAGKKMLTKKMVLLK